MPWIWTGNQGFVKGYGKGWGKGKWGKGGGRGSSRPKAIADDYVVPEGQVFTGTVSVYHKFSGYGFIAVDEVGVIPDDKVFAFWKNINSHDRFPTLRPDSKVQFKVAVIEKQGVRTLEAREIANVGGSPIAVQAESDAKKEFVGGANARYQGTLKFFSIQRQFGFIKILPGFTYDQEGVPEEIRTEFSEMNCGGGNPDCPQDFAVEFGIWKTLKGNFKAHNVTCPGGGPLPAVVDAPATAS